MKILVVNGPNLQLLGKRKTDIYGKQSLVDLQKKLKKKAAELGINVSFFQSCIEGELAEKIGNSGQEGYNGLIVNPAAYTHTSVAIRDAIEASDLPAIEVHISNIHKREEFRKKSLSAPVCVGQICGLGTTGYELAMLALFQILKNKNGR